MVLQSRESAATAVVDDAIRIIAQMLSSQTRGQVPKEVRLFAQCFAQCCHVDEHELVVATVYIARLQRRHPSLQAAFAVDSMIRIFVTAVILATKFLHDSVHPNSEWATASGRYSTADINKMEVEFLQLLDFNLFVSADEHAAMLARYGETDIVAMDVATKAAPAVPVRRTVASSTRTSNVHVIGANGETCVTADMDVSAAVTAVVNGPLSHSPDVYA